MNEEERINESGAGERKRERIREKQLTNRRRYFSPKWSNRIE